MSTTELKATKWAAQHTAGHEVHGQTAIYDEATGRDVAIVYDGDKHAELIVRAVNSHADMLEALEQSVEIIDALLLGQIPMGHRYSETSHAATVIHNAIKKARGIA